MQNGTRSEEIMNTVQSKVESVANEASENISEFLRNIRKTGDSAKKDALKNLNETAAAMRKQAREVSDDVDLRKQVDEVAQNLERTAMRLSKEADTVSQDAIKAVKSNPLRSVAIVFVIGLVVGLLLRDNGK